jgi:tmRNA-binding protein
MKKSARFNKDITIENRRARFDYEVIETLEMGIALMGSEVKSIACWVIRHSSKRRVVSSRNAYCCLQGD